MADPNSTSPATAPTSATELKPPASEPAVEQRLKFNPFANLRKLTQAELEAP